MINSSNKEIELDHYQKAIENYNHKLGTALCLPAVAGSGKSTSILAKIAKIIRESENPQIQAKRIIATTFSNKAARDLIKKFRITYPNLPTPQIGTLHSFGIKILKLDGIKPITMTAWNSTLLLRSCIEDLKILPEDTKKSYLTKIAETIKDIIANLKANSEFNYNRIVEEDYTDIKMYLPETTDEETTNIIESNFHSIVKLYEDKKALQNLFDYDDLLYKANILLEANETILNNLRASLDYVFIDEAQDCDKSQFDLFLRISEHKRLTLVYDKCQTLYKFRWSRPELLSPSNLQNYFTKIEELPLLYNYRSTENIVKIGNMLRNIANDPFTSHPSKENVKGSVKLKVCKTNISEGDVIASLIEEYIMQGYKHKDICVIARGNWYLRTIVEPALVRKNIPYIHSSSKSSQKLSEKNINRLVFSLISYLLDNNNYMAILDFIQHIKGVGPSFVEKVTELYMRNNGVANLSVYFRNKSDLEKCVLIESVILKLKEVSESLNSLTTSNLVNFLQDLILDFMVLPSSFEELQMIITAVANWINFYKETGEINIIDILETILLDINNFDVSGEKDAVCLSTIHQTKGLSIPVTICGGFTSATAPNNEFDDEQFMIYVQMSRAIDRLAIVYSVEYITKENKSKKQFINPFLEKLLQKIKENS